MNSVVRNSPTAQVIKEFKIQRRVHEGRDATEEEMLNIGRENWTAFLRRNRGKLATDRDMRLDV